MSRESAVTSLTALSRVLIRGTGARLAAHTARRVMMRPSFKVWQRTTKGKAADGSIGDRSRDSATLVVAALLWRALSGLEPPTPRNTMRIRRAYRQIDGAE